MLRQMSLTLIVSGTLITTAIAAVCNCEYSNSENYATSTFSVTCPSPSPTAEPHSFNCGGSGGGSGDSASGTVYCDNVSATINTTGGMEEGEGWGYPSCSTSE